MRSSYALCLPTLAGLIIACSSSTKVQDGTSPPGGGGDSGAAAAGGQLDAASGASTGGAGTGGAGTGGASTGGADTGGASTGGADTGGGAGAAAGGREVGGEAPGGADSGASVAGGGPTSGGDAGASGASTGGASTGGAGAAGGAGSASPVHGRLIDFWGHALPDVTVDVDGAVTTTNDDGEFDVAGVAAEYDVSFVVSAGITRRERHGWVFRGLTRRDPTLQVYSGLERRSSDFGVTQTGGVFGENRTLTVAFGSIDGTKMQEEVGETGLGLATMVWEGGSTTAATAHGLLFQLDPATGLPNDYLAYATAPVALSVDDRCDVSLDLSPEEPPIRTATVQGSVVPDAGLERENAVFVRFDTGATIELARIATDPDAYSFLVPILARASVTVAALEGGFPDAPFALAHVDGVGTGSNLTLTVPEPPTLLLPADGATGVTTTTPLRFLRGEGAGAAIVRIQRDSSLDTLNVVTASEEIVLPELPDSALAILASTTYRWVVEVHGDAASVDHLAGPAGFLDAFSWNDTYPTGPRRGSGTFTRSAARYFTPAP